MKQRVTLSVVDSLSHQIKNMADPAQKVSLLLAELGKLESANKKLQLTVDEKTKIAKDLEDKLKGKDEEISGLIYNYNRVKRRLDVLQEESKGQNKGMLGGLTSGFGFLKSGKQPIEDSTETTTLKARLEDVIVENEHYNKKITEEAKRHAEKEESLSSELYQIKKKTTCIEEELDELREESFKLHKEIDDQHSQIEKLTVHLSEERGRVDSLQSAMVNERQIVADLESYCNYYLTDIDECLIVLETSLDEELLKLIEETENTEERLKSNCQDEETEEGMPKAAENYLELLRGLRNRFSQLRNYSQSKRADKVHKFDRSPTRAQRYPAVKKSHEVPSKQATHVERLEFLAGIIVSLVSSTSSSASLSEPYHASSLNPQFTDSLKSIARWMKSSEKMNRIDTSAWPDIAALIKSSVASSLQIRLAQDNEKLRSDILELTQHTDIDFLAEKEESMFTLASEENHQLKNRIVDLESGIESLKKLVDKLSTDLAIKDNDLGAMAEKLTETREELFHKNETLSEVKSSLQAAIDREEELTHDAIQHKMKALKLREDIQTMQENYDTQIEDLSHKLIETLNQQQRR